MADEDGPKASQQTDSLLKRLAGASSGKAGCVVVATSGDVDVYTLFCPQVDEGSVRDK